MPVTAALGILLILIYARAIFADFIALYGQAEIFKDANVLSGGDPGMGAIRAISSAPTRSGGTFSRA